MKLILISTVCLFGAVLCKPTLTKRKRDILPGDPRYGTNYHQHHEHQALKNIQYEISRALGGYAGSYTVQDNDARQNNFQNARDAYEAPNSSPAQSIRYQQTVQQQTVQPVQRYVPAPSLSVSNFKASETVETISNAYLPSVFQTTQVPIVYQRQQEVHQRKEPEAASRNNRYLPPAATVAQPPVVQRVPAVPVYQQVERVVHREEQPQAASRHNVYSATAATVSQAPIVQGVSAATVYQQQVNHQQQSPNGYLGPMTQAAEQRTIQHSIATYPAPVVQHEAPASQELPEFQRAQTVQHTPVQYHIQSQNDVQQQLVQTVQNVPERARHVPEGVVHRRVVQSGSQSATQPQPDQVRQIVQPQATQVEQAVQPRAVDVQPAVQSRIVYESVPQNYNSDSNSGIVNAYKDELDPDIVSAIVSVISNVAFDNNGNDHHRGRSNDIFRTNSVEEYQNAQAAQNYRAKIAEHAGTPSQIQRVNAPQTYVQRVPPLVQPEVQASTPVTRVSAYQGTSESVEDKQVLSSVRYEQNDDNGGYVY